MAFRGPMTDSLKCANCGVPQENHCTFTVKCSRCGKVWIPRKPAEEIKECPSCKSRKWRKF